MKRITLIRHTLTDFNFKGQNGKFCGISNPPLNSMGIKEANDIAKLLENIPFDIIYTSPLIRARQTAEIINQLMKIPITVDGSLTEINYGIWENLTKVEVENQYPKEYNAFNHKNPISHYPKGGEDPKDIALRITKWLNQLSAEKILAVSHKTAIRLLLCTILKIPLQYYRNICDIKIGGIIVISGNNNNWTIEAINYGATFKRIFNL